MGSALPMRSLSGTRLSGLYARKHRTSHTLRSSRTLSKAWLRTFFPRFGALQLSTGHIAQKGLKDPEEAAAAATDYLRLLGFVAMGYCFAKACKIAHAKLAEGTEDEAFYKAKLITAQFFFDRLLPVATAQFMAIRSGKASMMDLPEEAF